MTVKKRHLKRARVEDVRRLARWLRLRDTDKMSDRQLICLIDWLFKRPEKRRLNLTWDGI